MRATVTNDVEVRMFKASKAPKAKVREADLGEAAAAVAYRFCFRRRSRSGLGAP